MMKPMNTFIPLQFIVVLFEASLSLQSVLHVQSGQTFESGVLGENNTLFQMEI